MIQHFWTSKKIMKVLFFFLQCTTNASLLRTLFFDLRARFLRCIFLCPTRVSLLRDIPFLEQKELENNLSWTNKNNNSNRFVVHLLLSSMLFRNCIASTIP